MRSSNVRPTQFVLFAALTGFAIYADAEPCPKVPMLQSDRPNLLGWATDSGDEHSYFDINISLATPMFYGTLTDGDTNCDLTRKWLPYFGVNMVAAFYAMPGDNRFSSPVIGKAFNPFIRYRRFQAGHNIASKDKPEVRYLDIEYGHISNGQSIATPGEFNATVVALGSFRSAQDYISRGWDYLGLNWHAYYDAPFGHAKYGAVTANVRKYIGGIFQQSIEEYYPDIEEPRGIQARNQVGGLRVSGKIVPIEPIAGIGGVALTLDTGLDEPFKRISGRIDMEICSNAFNFEKSGFALDLWARSGYDANLAHYYRRIDSVGIAFLFETFKGTQSPAYPLK